MAILRCVVFAREFRRAGRRGLAASGTLAATGFIFSGLIGRFFEDFGLLTLAATYVESTVRC
jgi:hypothetical protein